MISVHIILRYHYTYINLFDLTFYVMIKLLLLQQIMMNPSQIQNINDVLNLRSKEHFSNLLCSIILK